MKNETTNDYPSDVVVPFVNIITKKLNEVRTYLINETAQYHEALQRRKIDPEQVIETAMGVLSITRICFLRKIKLFERREEMLALESMLDEAKTSDLVLSNRWSEDALNLVDLGIKSPIQPEDLETADEVGESEDIESGSVEDFEPDVLEDPEA